MANEDSSTLPIQGSRPPEADRSVTAGLEQLLQRAERALASIGAGQDNPLPTALALPEFTPEPLAAEAASLASVREVELDLRIELGRAQLYLEEVLKLRQGSVVPLDKLAGDTVDILVNGQLVAKGEVLVLNDNFCVRVTEVLAGAEAGA